MIRQVSVTVADTAITEAESKIAIQRALMATGAPSNLHDRAAFEWMERVSREVDVDLTRSRVLSGRSYNGPAMKSVREVVSSVLGHRYEIAELNRRHALPEGQAAVESYMRCSEALLAGSQGDIRVFEQGARDGVEMARLLWASMREARVFEFPIGTWVGLYGEAQRSIAVWHEQKSSEIFADDVSVIERVNALGRAITFPEKLPFERMFIGIGAGYMLGEEMAMVRLRTRANKSDDLSSLMGAELLGYLIDGPQRMVYEMVHFIMVDDDFIMPIGHHHGDGGWIAGETFGPWLVLGMIAMINEHNTVVTNHVPTLGMKLAAKKMAKSARIGFIPKPYYTLKMRHRVIDESELDKRGDGPGHVLSRRYDRRGHERCYVERGEAPIDPKLEAKLIKYGYRFLPSQPIAEDLVRIAYRNMPPKRTNEWMAIKVRWIADKVCGSQDLPYVPAVRVPE